MIATQCTVLTPVGSFQVQWGDDDASPVEYSGNEAAIEYFRAYMQAEAITGEGGQVLDPDWISPVDLIEFCPSPQHGIAVLSMNESELQDAAAATLAGIESGQAVLDSVSPIERIRLVKMLGDAVAQLKAATSPIERVKGARVVAEVLAKLGVGVATVDAPSVDPEDDGLSDDPASENYRYKDTGYIANSRKEIAANMIRVARTNGQRVRSTDIDWNAIEQNPRQAAELIVKSNLFGKTDWQALRDAGMEPGAAYLIDKVYAAIGTEPTNTLPKVVVQALSGGLSGATGLAASGVLDRDSPEAVAQTRKDFALGLETIRERLEKCRTADEVMGVLAEIRDELSGVSLSAEQSDALALIDADYQAKRKLAKDEKAKYDAVFREFMDLSRKRDGLIGENGRRVNRGWKPDPEIEKQIAELEPAVAAAEKVFRDYQAAHPELTNQKRVYPSGGFNYLNDLEYAADQVRREMDGIVRNARYHNLLNNQATRAWLSFGDRFFNLLNYRSVRGSNAFGVHVTTVRSGRINDWSWADKEKPTGKIRRPTGESINFQLAVAENYVRTGGSEVPVSSTTALKDMLGLQDVQSGNWVLRDQVSAKFHVEQTAAAMSDMSDMLGIEMKHLGLGGRLSMAFGARGRGGKGAARAHYEPVQRVVNLTKMGGGGALGHELFHAFDNILPSLVSGKAGGKDEFASIDPSLMPVGAIRDAFQGLREAMLAGPHRLMEQIKIGPGDRQLAIRNVDAAVPNQVGRAIKAAGAADAAVMAVDRIFAGRDDRRSLANKKRWRALAAAYYSPEGSDIVTLATGRQVSSFASEAQLLDDGQDGKYWSQVEELAARAFQAYLEDSLEAKGRRNDYLSYGGNNSHYDGAKPFPEGDERVRINAAFDTLFGALRQAGVFESASSNKALLDSIFGVLDAVDPGERDTLLAELQAAASPMAKIMAAKAMAEAMAASNSESLPEANANGIIAPEPASTGGEGSMMNSELVAEANALVSELAKSITVSARDAERLRIAVDTFASGYTTKAAKTDAVATASSEFGGIRNLIQQAYLDIPNDERTEQQGEVYWGLPMYANQWRQKHADAVMAAFPGQEENLKMIDRAIRLREILSSGEVVKAPTKAETRKARVAVASAGGSMDPGMNDIVAQLNTMKPSVAMEWADEVKFRAQRLLERFQAGEDMKEHFKSTPNDAWITAFLVDGGSGPSSVDTAKIDKMSTDYAEQQVSQLIYKLLQKVGNLKSVTINNMNANSLQFNLTGKLGDKSVTINQSRIINSTMQGNPYHQWPARITVDGKAMSEAQYRGVSGQEAPATIEVGSKVRVRGKTVVVTGIRRAIAHGIGPGINGQEVDYVYWQEGGRERGYPKRYARLA